MHYSGSFFCVSPHRPRRATGVLRHICTNHHGSFVPLGFPLLHGPHHCALPASKGRLKVKN